MNQKHGNGIFFSNYTPEESFLPLFVRIHSPWNSDQYALAECPEHFNSLSGWVMNHRKDIPMIHQMSRPIEWTFSADRKNAEYSYAFDDGIAFNIQLHAEEKVVRVNVELINGSPTSLKFLEPFFCLRLDQLSEFTTPQDKLDHLRRTFIICDGQRVSMMDVHDGIAEAHRKTNPQRVWTGCAVKGENRDPEYWWFSKKHFADYGLIATESPDGGRWLVFTWKRTRLLFTNIACPCIHAQPVLPDCAPGEMVRNEGRIVFFEGAWESLLKTIFTDAG